MKRVITSLKFFLLAAVVLSCIASFAAAQTPSSAPAGTTMPRIGAVKDPTSPEYAIEMSPPQQLSDYQHFQQVSPEQFAKKITLGEQFINKYPDSSFNSAVYSTLTVLYIQSGQPEKGFAAGAKAVLLNPKDVRTMGVLSQSMARSYNPGMPNAAQRLEKAQEYGKQAVAVAPTLKKPDAVTAQEFEAANQESLVMAHSGLGLVDVRNAKYADAITELTQAVKLDAKHDPTNLYLLGVAYQNTSQFTDAAAAFTKCADAPGNLQETCKSAADVAKKRIAPQSAPAK